MNITPATFVNRRWRWATLAVILGVLFLARLGTWQLDRLEWRREQNVIKRAELQSAPLDLNEPTTADLDLTTMLNRTATVRGRYDFEQQFVIESQIYNQQQGRYLLTPLVIDGRDAAVLVNRGWLPVGETDVAAYNRPTGPIDLTGYIQYSQSLSGDRQTTIQDGNRLFRIDVAVMNEASPYTLLPVYLLDPPAEDDPNLDLPAKLSPDLSLDEGNHFSYALQWFTFSLMLAGIYVYYVNKQAAEPPSNE